MRGNFWLKPLLLRKKTLCPPLSDANIDIELQAKRGNKFLFYSVSELQRIVCISATRFPIAVRFGLKCSIFNGQV